MALVIPIVLLGLAASLSPSTTVVFIFLLGSSRARVNGVAFLVGWGASLTVVFAASYAVGGALGSQKSAAHVAVEVIEIILGAALIAVAPREWRRRKLPRTSGVFQRLHGRLEDLHPWEAGIVGFLKQPWTLTAAAAVVVVHHHSAAVVVLVAFLAFTLASTFTVATIFVYFTRHPMEAEPHLSALRERVVQGAPMILAVVSLLVGCYLVVDGIVGLITK